MFFLSTLVKQSTGHVEMAQGGEGLAERWELDCKGLAVPAHDTDLPACEHLKDTFQRSGVNFTLPQAYFPIS